MMDDPAAPPGQKPGLSEKDRREARRKEALKANMARRKAQVRARGVDVSQGGRAQGASDVDSE